jgi:hypothetical protein
VTGNDAPVAHPKNFGPDTWLGSWEADLFTLNKHSIRWLSPLRGALISTVVTVGGLHFGGAAVGVPLGVGALFAAVADVDQVASRRLRTMLWATLWLTVATALGGIGSLSLPILMLIAIPVTAACGYAGVLGARAVIAGVLTLVTFSAFTFTPMSAEGIGQATLLVAAGALIQTAGTVIAIAIREPKALLAQDSSPPLRPRLNGHTGLQDDFVRHAIRLIIAMEIAFSLQYFFTDIHSVWIPITVAWVTTPDRHGTVTKSVGRIIGTLVGVGLVLLAGWLTDYSDVMLVIAFTLSAFLALVMLRANYSIAVVGVTGFMLTMFAIAGDNLEVLGTDRILDTVIAAIIVLTVIMIVLRVTAQRDQQ